MPYRLMPSFALCALVLAGPAAAADAPGKPSSETLEIYQTKCQTCHMPDGNAPLEMMNLADGTWKHGSRKADVVKVITEGIPLTAMLPFNTQLTPAQIAALADYVRSFDKTLKPEKPAKAVKKASAKKLP